MKTNSLLEELWRVKDDLAREAGYDLDRIFAELREAHPRSAQYMRARKKQFLISWRNHPRIQHQAP
jgi:hypothetical protein